MDIENLEERSKRFQNSPLKPEDNDENFDEYEQDYDEAFENTDSLKASSCSMTYSVSKTGGIDENLELPGPRYAAIEEHPEENEESKFQQPTQEELDLQRLRIQKAKDALIKMKKEEISNKAKNKNQKLIGTDKPVKAPIKPTQSRNNIPEKIPVTKAVQNDTKNAKKPSSTKNLSERPAVKEPDPAESAGFMGFSVEKPVKATSTAAPGANPIPQNKLAIPPLKLNPSTSGESAKAKKKEADAKALEDHKGNLENLKVVFDQKKAKTEQNLKNMEMIQKKLLDKEKDYKIPEKEPPKPKKTPQPPPAPRPRALQESCYKLHQLAETTGNKDNRLSADKISGSMLQAIKILSAKISEEFPYQEIQVESKRISEAEKTLATGKDMKRGEVDYNEEAKKKLITYKSLIAENLELVKKKSEMLKAQDDLIDRIKKLEPQKAVVKLGDGKYIRAGSLPEGLVDTMEELDSVGSEVMKENPVDVVVEKIEGQGSTLKQLFCQIDGDGDKILTITEIRNGLAGIQVKLTEEDKALLVKTLDSNSDGVVSEEEFFKILDPKLRAQQEYKAIIGNLDVNNPIIFEERILDMKLKGRMLHKEIPAMVNRLKSKIESENRLLARIKNLEKILQDRQIKSITVGNVAEHYEEQIKEAQDKKLQIFRVGMQEKSTNSSNLTQLQEKVKTVSKEKAKVAAELEYSKNALTSSKITQGVLEQKKKKLEEANRVIAIVMIQCRVKRYIARVRYIKEKERVEKALNVIVPALRTFTSAQKEKRALAATISEKSFKAEPEPKEEIKELSFRSDSHSEKGSTHSQSQYSCVKCGKSADRLCLSCLWKLCPKCYNSCKAQLHNFGLIESDSPDLTSAEHEFIEEFKLLQLQNHLSLSDLFKSAVPKGSTTISYVTMRKLLMDLKPPLEKYLIQNLLILAAKYLTEDILVDISTFCHHFNS